jgi:competence protein ComEA
MNAAPPPAPVPAPPAPAVPTAWPRSAQLAAAFLLGVATVLLVVHAYGGLRGGSRPTGLQPGTAPAYRIDLNQAGRADLLQLPGVSDTMAGRIEDFRREHGGFRSVDELAHVQGVGPATLQRLRPWVCVQTEVEEESEPATPAREMPSAATGVGSKKTAGLSGQIDLNRATAEELQRLPGIGPKLSQRIIEERGKAPFKSADDLKRVPGIGAKTIEKLRPYVTVGKDPTRLASSD